MLFLNWDLLIFFPRNMDSTPILLFNTRWIPVNSMSNPLQDLLVPRMAAYLNVALHLPCKRTTCRSVWLMEIFKTMQRMQMQFVWMCVWAGRENSLWVCVRIRASLLYASCAGTLCTSESLKPLSLREEGWWCGWGWGVLYSVSPTVGLT